jgi:hypothetical protein
MVETNRGKFFCSPNHLWKTESGFVMAAMLAPGARLISRIAGAMVIQVKPYPGTFQVFNLHVDHAEHTYMVGGIVVHNVKPSEGSGLYRTTLGSSSGLYRESSALTPSAAVNNISNVFNMGGQTVNNGMDAAQLRQFILKTVREAI